MDKVKAVMQNKVSRRKFITGVSAGMGATAAVSFAAGCGGSSTPNPTPTPPPGSGSGTTPAYADSDILNFALNLEYLEAEFYLRAATGTGLTAADIGTNPGTVTGGAQVTFATPIIQQYANEIANDELLHVRFLRKALGAAAVDRPQIDFTAGFSGLGAAAGFVMADGKTPFTNFNPFADENSFIVGAFTFEDVGVTAYHGAAKLLTDKTTNLAAAAGIMATEAYHSGEIRTLLAYLGTNPSGATPSTAIYLTYANQISAVRGVAGSGMEAPILTLSVTNSVTTVQSSTVIAPADANSLAFERTTDQVLHIVYLSPKAGAVASGGFFPKGINGKFAATTT